MYLVINYFSNYQRYVLKCATTIQCICFLFIDQHSMDRFDNTREMEPTIELDHLATYSSKSGKFSCKQNTFVLYRIMRILVIA